MNLEGWTTAHGGGWGQGGPNPGPFGPHGGSPPGGASGGGPYGGGPPGGGFDGRGGGRFAPVIPGSKPITGGKETMALHAMTIDPRTGLPAGERPPASTAAVIALVCGVLLCLGPMTGVVAIVAGIIGRWSAARSPLTVGGGGLSLVGILLGALNLILTLGFALMFLAGAIGG